MWLFASLSLSQSSRSVTVCADSLPIIIRTDIQGLSYLWNTGDTTDSIQVSDTGQYTVTVTFDLGQDHIDSIYLSALYPPIVDLSFTFDDSGNLMLEPQLLGDTTNLASPLFTTWITPLNTYNKKPFGTVLMVPKFCLNYCSDSLYGNHEFRIIVENLCGIDTAIQVINCEDECWPLYSKITIDHPPFLVWPNPSSGVLYQSLPKGSNTRYELLNPKGCVVKSGYLGNSDDGTDTLLDLSELPDGIYYYRVQSNEYEFTRKILKISE
ncbi:MAG: T9SS type A sorting domain-containing protein [Flavobacteriales bacterium]